MTEKTIKELLEMEFFPTDDQGRQLVPNSYGDVTVVSHDMPGRYPIIGVGPYGQVDQFNEYGCIRGDKSNEGDWNFSDSDVELNSLTPPDMQRIVQFVVVEADGTVECSYDTRDQAESMSGPGQQIVELDGYGYVADITDASDLLDEGQTYSDDAKYLGDVFTDAQTVGQQAQHNEAPFGGYSDPTRFDVPGLYPRFPWTRG